MRRFWNVRDPAEESLEDLVIFFSTLPHDSASHLEFGSFSVPISDVINATTADLLKALIMGLGGKRFQPNDGLLERLRRQEELSEEELAAIQADTAESIELFNAAMVNFFEKRNLDKGEVSDE